MLFKSISNILLFCFLSSVFSIGAPIHVILEETALIDCYDPDTALKSHSFFVDVMFTSSIPGSQSNRILSYQPFQQKYIWDDTAYEGFIKFYSSGVLEKTNIVFMNEGTYSCISRDVAIQPTIKTTQIIVLAAPVVEVKMISSPLVAGNQVVTVAQCAAKQGKPPAVLNWFADSPHSIFEQDRSNFTASSLTTVISELKLAPFKSYNKQTFRCEIRHAAFEKNNITTITLNVTYPPDTPKIFISQDKTYLTCIADGNPLPVYEWTLPSGSKPPKVFGPDVKLSTQFDPNHQNDTYTCVASNSAGKSVPVNITSFEAYTSKSQTNVWIFIGIGVAVLFVLFLVLYVYCRFVKSRDKQMANYEKRDYLIRHNTERYMQPPIQHPNNSLHRPPSPVNPPPDECYYDDIDEYDVEIGNDYSRENGDEKLGMKGPVVSFKKQRIPPPMDDFYPSKEAKFSSDEVERISRHTSSKYSSQHEYSSSYSSEYSDEDSPRETPPRFDSLSDYEAKSRKSDRSSKKGSMKPVQYTEI